MKYAHILKAERNLDDIQNLNLLDTNLINTGAIDGQSSLWMKENKEKIKSKVAEDGWVLIRGLNALTATDFKENILALDMPLMEKYGDLPMAPSSDGTSGVFNVTKYPQRNGILFHNEGSHTHASPRHIFFQCSEAAPQGGETPMADSALVYREIPPEILSVFAKRGLLYRRSFIENLDVSWSQFFGTSQRHEVELICKRQNIEAHWTPQGNLVTETFRPAVISHPENGSDLFFNQILLHHPACLEPEARKALKNLSPQGLMPRDVYFGDGTPIPDEWIAEVLRANIRAAVSFHWRPGDIVIVDNLAVAHARRPYSGARRHHVILSR
jgi:alpha-ketoglutarate-dependent taurine dioxygenase